MTSAIEYSVIWNAAADETKYTGAHIPARSISVEQIVAEANAQRAAMIAAAFAGLKNKLVQVLRRVVTAQKRRSAVAQLMAMDDRMLRDIGLSRTEVPLVVCGLASGETPNVLANAVAFDRLQANENRSHRAA